MPRRRDLLCYAFSTSRRPLTQMLISPLSRRLSHYMPHDERWRAWPRLSRPVALKARILILSRALAMIAFNADAHSGRLISCRLIFSIRFPGPRPANYCYAHATECTVSSPPSHSRLSPTSSLLLCVILPICRQHIFSQAARCLFSLRAIRFSWSSADALFRPR